MIYQKIKTSKQKINNVFIKFAIENKVKTKRNLSIKKKNYLYKCDILYEEN